VPGRGWVKRGSVCHGVEGLKRLSVSGRGWVKESQGKSQEASLCLMQEQHREAYCSKEE
jgi:hypothetical protein